MGKTKTLFEDINFGLISAPLYALNEQKEKETGKGTIQAMATYYYQNAVAAVNGNKKERELAVGFFLQTIHNIAAVLYNNGIDIDDYRKTADYLSDRWEGKTQDK